MINFADYEFTFGTKNKTFCIKRFPDNPQYNVVMYIFRNEVINDFQNDILIGTMQFSNEEWADFSMVFGNRYVKGWNPNGAV